MTLKATIFLFLLFFALNYHLNAQNFLNYKLIYEHTQKNSSLKKEDLKFDLKIKDLSTLKSFSDKSESSDKYEASLNNFTTKKSLSSRYDYLLMDSITAKLDSIMPWDSRKHVGIAIAEVAIIQLIPYGIAKWITKPGWEKVSPRTWWNNISHGFTYDTDNFLTNHFSHPYHGNLYFNAARTNGYGFWESSPFAFLGSVIWEYFGETFRPSFNDWVNTGFSGVNLGEMTYRLSNLITDNTAVGYTRVWKEILGGLVNPVRGFNRLFTGEATRNFPNPPLKNPGYFSLQFTAGMRRIVTEGSDIIKNGFQEGVLGFDITYGDHFKSDLSVPFANFYVTGSFANGEDNITDLRSYGTLIGWKLQDKPRVKHTFSVMLNYDFTSNPAYEFGGPTIAANFATKFVFNNKLNIITHGNVGALLMGGTPDEFFYGEEGRDYSFGPGVIIRLHGSLNYGSWNIAGASYSSFWLWTQAGSIGSKHHVHNFNIMGTLPINKYFGIGIASGVYWRESYYVEPSTTVKRSSPILRIFFITKL